MSHKAFMSQRSNRGSEYGLDILEVRMILQVVEPGFKLSGGFRSRAVGPDWCGERQYIGREYPLTYMREHSRGGVSNDAYYSLAESLAAFIAMEGL